MGGLHGQIPNPDEVTGRLECRRRRLDASALPPPPGAATGGLTARKHCPWLAADACTAFLRPAALYERGDEGACGAEEATETCSGGWRKRVEAGSASPASRRARGCLSSAGVHKVQSSVKD